MHALDTPSCDTVMAHRNDAERSLGLRNKIVVSERVSQPVLYKVNMLFLGTVVRKDSFPELAFILAYSFFEIEVLRPT
jgi:hypothetical protein